MQGTNQITTPALQVVGLSKKLRKKQIIHKLDLCVQPGEIMGFLGPNGAGKTTVIKLIRGLLSVDEGNRSICGINAIEQPELARQKIGGIIENPELYSYLSGLENLKLCAKLYPNVTEERINQVVQLVKLQNRINDKVRRYSLGMRQRLGLAQALLASPKLLILDEPTNGLDPVGIKDMREILLQMKTQENVAVLISSHQLAELEQLCDRVSIINGGTITLVKDLQQEIREAQTVLLITNNNQQAMELLKDYGPTIQENGFTIGATYSQIPQLNRILVENQIDVHAIVPQNHSLEDLFLQSTTDEPVK